MTDRILEIGSAGLETADQRVRKLMDNMVGAEVPGYKKSEVVVRGFPLELDNAQNKISSMKPQVESTHYKTASGALVKTNNKLDVALGSEGYFVVSGPWGEGYTRDGRFRLDKEGRLITVAGNLPVVGKMGPVIVTPGSEVEFTQEGEIKVDGAVVDRLQILKPEGTDALASLNGSIFKKSSSLSIMTEVDDPRLIQGYVESSNASIVDQMMEMMQVERLNWVMSKVISTRDQNLSRAMELGRPTQ
ncbi:MAG: flagellar hook basal-body protein [Candidatus Margulisbacteria bacterium]|nr:flagellar hook basal-body protein [Candidatus Margulisiibacteriota bacterium]